MTPAETIAAAITVLENDMTDATWSYHHEVMSLRANGVTLADGVMPPDGERILRWQRTLKAQLHILQYGKALVWMSARDDMPFGAADGEAEYLDLAEAILGMEES